MFGKRKSVAAFDASKVLDPFKTLDGILPFVADMHGGSEEAFHKSADIIALALSQCWDHQATHECGRKMGYVLRQRLEGHGDLLGRLFISIEQSSRPCAIQVIEGFREAVDARNGMIAEMNSIKYTM